MSKAKSIVVTVILAIAVAVAAFFAAISFPVANNVKRLNSIASNIHLGADFSGYAYTRLYPEGVLTHEEYQGLLSDENEPAKAEDFYKVGSLYVEKEQYPAEEDVAKLKEEVAADAAKLNKRFGQKGYSSYSVGVEDGLVIKVSVPTNFTYAAYKKNDDVARSNDLTAADNSINALSACGAMTLRTSDSEITLTDASGNSSKLTMTKFGKDQWVDTATVTPSGSSTAQKTYSLAGVDNVADYFDSVTSRTVGKTSVITFHLSKEGEELFKQVATRAVSSTSKIIYFFLGNTQLIAYNCTEVPTGRSISLQHEDAATAQNAAIALNSAVKGEHLTVAYKNAGDNNVVASSAQGGNLAGLMVFIASIVVLVGITIGLCVKFKRLGALTSFMTFTFALVLLYAMCLLEIQLTFGVLFTCAVCVALFVVSNLLVFKEIKRLTESGRTMQASVKEGYKNFIMTISDMHIVLVVAAILLATVAVGEVAACGLIAVIGVVASYVLYWFNRFMWFVTSSPVKDKFGFAGLKRVVYEDD